LAAFASLLSFITVLKELLLAPGIRPLLTLRAEWRASEAAADKAASLLLFFFFYPVVGAADLAAERLVLFLDDLFLGVD